MNVFQSLVVSRKFVVLVLGLVCTAVLAALHVATCDQFIEVLKWGVGSFVVATGLEGAPKAGGVA